MTIWIILGLVALLALWAVMTYNGLIGLKNQVQNGWTQIDVQLKRRHDLIPNLVSTVKGFMQFEQETLEKVIQARQAAVSAEGVKASSEAENALTQTLGRLFALTESYPELKSNENVLKLQEELTATENKIAFARQFYNDVVMRFNTAQEVFPANMLAGRLGFKRAEFFEAEEAVRVVPAVDLSINEIMDLFAQQARNRRMTWLLMGVFGLLLLAVGYAVDPGLALALPLQAGSVSLSLPLAPVGAVGASGLLALFSYFKGDQVILASMQARPLDETRPEERQFRNVAEEMAIAAGLPMPRLYVVPDADLNAFATGRSPAHAAVAVTEGLLEALDREELQAVVAHEFGHVKSLDIRLMMIVSVMLGAIALLGDMALRSGRSRRSSREKGGANPVLLVVAIVAPLIARILAMAVSRTREFEADRAASEFTRNPLALARALAKLEAAQTPTRYATQGTAHLFVVDPRVSSLNDRQDWFGNLFATHPPIKQRIERLENMGYGSLEAAS